jgi:RNA polymerase sigma-70 factor (ECF subfamily)
MPELQNLLAQVREGGSAGEQAMADILQRYNGAMRRMARRMIGPQIQSQVDSEDLMQSMVISLWQGLPAGKFDVASPKELMSLVKVLLRRKAARRWRRKQLEINATKDGNLAEPAARAEDDPCQKVGVRDFVEHFLNQLSPGDRQMIKLRLGGLSTAEAAEHLGVDAAALRVRLARLRRRSQRPANT